MKYRDLHDELLTVSEIAEWLKLNPQTIGNWIADGRLPHLRVGQRRVRVWRSDLDAFIARTAKNAAAPVRPKTVQRIWDGVIPPPQLPSG